MTTARRARFSSSRGKDPKALEVKGKGRWLIELAPLLAKECVEKKGPVLKIRASAEESGTCIMLELFEEG
jgi:hypothetical protein